MNEATLEMRVSEELRRIFPLFEGLHITHQKSFTLQLGHNHIIVNGFEKSIAGGRLDILINYKDKPLAILELKSPKVTLDKNDIKQGISYARLLTPMPPLVIISNGHETEYYHSFNMEQWIPKNISEEIIQSLFKYGASCADADHDHAIKILLGQQPDLWKNIIRDFTEKELNGLKGKIDDFSYPISSNFQVERSIISDIIASTKVNPLVNLIGSPLSGKTNVAYQFCYQCSTNIIPIYIGSTLNYGILQKISNWLSNRLFKLMTPNDVRHWLINSFKNQSDIRLIIIIDNLLSLDDMERWKDIFELIDINENNGFSILLIMNEYVFDKIGVSSRGPAKNKIGRAPVFKLLPLTDDEFNKACKHFLDKFGAFFHKGAQYNVEFRNPRLLRVLVTQLTKIKNVESQSNDIVIALPSITSFDILYDLWNNMVTNMDLQTDLRYLVETILKDEHQRKVDHVLSIMSYCKGTITLKTAELILGYNRIEKLKSNGIIEQFNLKGGKSYIYPRFPEAVAAAAAFYLGEKLVNMYLQNKKSQLYNYLKKAATLFPYGDLVATMAIYEACKNEPDILTELIYKLKNDIPKIEKTPTYGKYLAYFEDIGEVSIDGKLDGLTICNSYPWLILSHIASLPIGTEEGNRDIQLKILYKIGSFRNILLRIDNIPFKDMKGYHVHDIAEDCSFICGKVGIIEPITFAMQRGFYSMPEKMLEFTKYAVERDNECLLMRLDIAVQSTLNCSDLIVCECSQKAEKLLSDSIKKSYVKHLI